MKKILIFSLFFLSVCHAQIVKDISVYRGDSTRIEFKANGNITAKGITFVVKLTKSFSSPRLIQKKNTIAGGSSSEIITSYSAPQTKVTVILGPEDTQDLTGATYYYDIVAADAVALESYYTFNYGKFTFTNGGDVQTPWDGTNLPGGGVRVGTIAIANATSLYSTIVWDTTGKFYYPISLNDFKTILNISVGSNNVDSLGDKPASDYITKNDTSVFISDALADAKYIDKSSTQIVTGEKTFSNNKTVFGTTTNDSTRVTGRLQVNNLSVGSKYNLTTGTGFMVSSTTMRQQNFLGSQIVNKISNTDLDITFGGAFSWGLTGATGSGLFAYNLEPYSFGFNSQYGQPIYFGINSYMALGLFPEETYMEIKSLKFGSLVNDIFNPVDKVTFVADTFNITGVTIINGSIYAPSGSVTNADSLGGVPSDAYTLNDNLNNWTTNLSSGNGTQLRLGKSYADRRFNNGAYSDNWIIDYVVPPYNLSSDWLYPIEHRTDYYNDTLNTVAHSDILNIDGTGTPIWRTNDVRIMGNEVAINVGDLPDSIALSWTSAGLFGSSVILGEANKTAGSKRFPMPVYGYNFQLNFGSDYDYPYLYSFYSNLVDGNTNEIDKGYHFYGEGNFPSYFGGDIEIPLGNLKTGSATLSQSELGYLDGVTSSIQNQLNSRLTSSSSLNPANVSQTSTYRFTTDTEKSTWNAKLGTADIQLLIDSVYRSNDTIYFHQKDGSRLYFVDQNSGGAGDTSDYTLAQMDSLLNLAGTALQSATLEGDTLNYTASQMDSLLNLAGTALQSSNMNSLAEFDTQIGITGTPSSSTYWRGDNSWATVPSTFDTTFVYRRITALESSVDSLSNLVSAILSALDTCGCGAIIVEDNTPPLKPTSYVAVGGSSQTQYVSTWTDPVAADLDSIRFYEGSANDSTSLVWITSIAGGLQTYTRTGRTANTTYWSAVKAVDDSGNVSYFSNLDSAKTLASGGGGIGAAFDSAGTTIDAGSPDLNTFAWDYSAQVGINYTPTSTNRTVGAVSININAIVGTLGMNFEAVICSVGTSNALGTVIASSTARTLTSGWCKFDFTAGVTLTASTEYYIAVRRVDKSFNGDNYAYVNYGTNEWLTGASGASCNAQLWYGTTDARYDHYDNPYTFKLYVWE